MSGREVEAVEVVARRLDLATVHDPVPQPEEHVLHFPPDLGDQVQPAALLPRDRERDVHSLLGEPPVELRPLERGLPGGDGRLDALAGRVEGHPGLPVANLAQRELELALPAEVLDAHALDLVGRRGGGDGLRGSLLERLDVHGERGYPARPAGARYISPYDG